METRRNLAREHSNLEWNSDVLYWKKYRYLNKGCLLHLVLLPWMHKGWWWLLPPYTLAHDQLNQQIPEIFPIRKLYVFTVSDVITDHQKRLDVVKKERLCFNYLAHHKVSECKSKHYCNTCKQKHHTSLCNGGDNTNGKNESSNQNVTPPTSHTLLSTMPKPMNTQPIGLG